MEGIGIKGMILFGMLLAAVAMLVWGLMGRKPFFSKVKIKIKDNRIVSINRGKSLLIGLAEQKIYLPSSCGGGGSCGKCKCRVTKGGGSIRVIEKSMLTDEEISRGWRLGCQVKVKGKMEVDIAR